MTTYNCANNTNLNDFILVSFLKKIKNFMSTSYVVYYLTTVLHTQHSIHDQHYWHVTCPI